MRRSILAACLLPLLSGAASAATELRYDWLTQGQRSGELRVAIDDDGTRRSHFEFSDRGRGPNQDERVVLDQAGLIRELEISGRSYLGAKVEERFRRDDGRAHWSTLLDRGDHRSGESAFYAATDGTPDQIGILARALLATPERRLALLPSGEARIEALQTHTVARDHESREVTLYAINGLDFTPYYVWLDAQRELFAISWGWMGLMPEGWSAAFPQLRDWQEGAEEALLKQRARQLTERLPDRWCVHNVRLLDVDAGTLQSGAAVRVQAGRIEAAGEAAGVDCTGLHAIDGGGRVLMPGLWDMHVHVSAADGLLHIANGITGARDLANDHDRIMALQSSYESGELVGPRLQRSGFIDRRGPYTAPTGTAASTLEEALEHVDWYADRGYPQIKIYSSIEPEWVKPIAERIHSRGLKLSGHIPAFMSTHQAVKDGYDEIQHLNMLFLNFLDPGADTRTPVRFELVGAKGGDLDLDSGPVQEFIADLARRGTVVDPTVNIFDNMFRHRSGTPAPALARVIDHLPPTVRRGALSGRLAIDDGNAATYARSADALLKMLLKLHQAGVTLVPGTDAMPGFTLLRELELYAQAGIPNADVLRIATVQSARVAGFGDSVGRIAPGYAADLILLDGDPLSDISALRRTALVVRGDRAYRPDRIFPLLGIRPFVPSVQ